MDETDQIYLVMFYNSPIAAHREFQGAAEILSGYSVTDQQHMDIKPVRLYD